MRHKRPGAGFRRGAPTAERGGIDALPTMASAWRLGVAGFPPWGPAKPGGRSRLNRARTGGGHAAANLASGSAVVNRVAFGLT